MALVATLLRRELTKRWIWLGAGLAFLIFLPNLVWQWQHGFPTLEDLHNVRVSGKNVVLGPVQFLIQQVMMMHPVTMPVWVAGLWFLLLGKGRRFAALGWMFLTLFAVMLLLHGKDYYLAPAYPMLLAAGSVACERWLDRRAKPSARALLRVSIPTLIVLAGIVTAPLALPLLEPASFVAYQKTLGISPQKTEVTHDGPLPQLWGDQFGWPELVEDVAAVYWSLPDDERSRTAIFAGNFGEAGAINLFGPEHGLPPAVCAYQTHSFWGPPTDDPDVIIWLNGGASGWTRCAAPSRRPADTTIPGVWRKKTARSTSVENLWRHCLSPGRI